MDRGQFMNELYERLRMLPNDEREKALNYYEEYFDDAGVENEANVLKELGDVSKIAEEIIQNSTTSSEAKSANRYSSFRNENSDNYRTNDSRNDNYNSVNEVNSNYTKKRRRNPMWTIFTIIGIIVAGPILIGLILGFFGFVLGLILATFGLVFSGIVGLFTLPFVGIAAIGAIFFNLGKALLSVALLIVGIYVVIKIIKIAIAHLKVL